MPKLALFVRTDAETKAAIELLAKLEGRSTNNFLNKKLRELIATATAKTVIPSREETVMA
jgi:hypothetical protein